MAASLPPSSAHRFSCLAEEFRAVQEDARQLEQPVSQVAVLPHNSSKNRYTDVLPNEASRVRLKGLISNHHHLHHQPHHSLHHGLLHHQNHQNNHHHRKTLSLSTSPPPSSTTSFIGSPPSSPTSSSSSLPSLPSIASSSTLPTSDYINASYVYGVTSSAPAYIACQAPLPNTFQDFWQMVWEHSSAVIVMLTNLVERDRVKAHRYWPSGDGPNESLNLGALRITLLRHTVYDDTTIRCLRLQTVDPHSGKPTESRTIYHLQYGEWTDKSVPKNTHGILNLLRITSVCKQLAASRGLLGPLISHCSAGIGRTGAFIAIDIAVQKLVLGQRCSIPKIVQTMRTQRRGMVQTKEQYAFIYRAIHAWLQALHSCAPSPALFQPPPPAQPQVQPAITRSSPPTSPRTPSPPATPSPPPPPPPSASLPPPPLPLFIEPASGTTSPFAPISSAPAWSPSFSLSSSIPAGTAALASTTPSYTWPFPTFPACSTEPLAASSTAFATPVHSFDNSYPQHRRAIDVDAVEPPASPPCAPWSVVPTSPSVSD